MRKIAITVITPTFAESEFLRNAITRLDRFQDSINGIVAIGGAEQEDVFPTPPNISLLRLNPDPGLVSCLNQAAALVETDYFCFLSDDNELAPEYPSKMIAFLERYSQVDYLFCNQTHILEGRSSTESEAATRELNANFGRNDIARDILPVEDASSYIRQHTLPLEGCLIRKSAWLDDGPFRSESNGAFDNDFVYRILIKKKTIGFIKEPLVCFKWRKTSYSGTRKLEHLQGTNWSLSNISAELGADEKDVYDAVNAQLLRAKQGILSHKLSLHDRISLTCDLLMSKRVDKAVLANLKRLAKLLFR